MILTCGSGKRSQKDVFQSADKRQFAGPGRDFTTESTEDTEREGEKEEMHPDTNFTGNVKKHEILLKYF